MIGVIIGVGMRNSYSIEGGVMNFFWLVGIRGNEGRFFVGGNN